MNNLTPLCGYLSEKHAWQLMKETALSLQGQRPVPQVCPQSISWDGQHFHLSATAATPESCSLPPEGNTGSVEAAVWQLGASLFHLFMGCPVFHGKGGAAQESGSPVPYMRKQLPELSDMVCRMLAYEPARRPTLESIATAATQQLTRLQSHPAPRQRKPVSAIGQASNPDFWPYEFE